MPLHFMRNLLQTNIGWLSGSSPMHQSKAHISQLWFGLWVMAFSLTWLLPNHYVPWSAFHSDAWCAVWLAVIATVVLVRVRLDAKWYPSDVVVACLICIPGLQYAANMLPFAGQAWITSAFLLGLWLAMQCGQRWERIYPGQLAGRLLAAIAMASLVSVSLQLGTLFDVMEQGIFDIWSMGLMGARPYANMGQPNQLATLLLWGMIACGWGYSQKKISGWIAVIFAIFLLLGISLTQSRTAWLGLLFICIATFVWRKHWPSRQVPWLVCGLFALFWLWPPLVKALVDFLMMGSDQSFVRPLGQDDLRISIWRLFAGAVMESPWLGYGWNDVVAAQLAVVENFAPVGGVVAHSHNLFFDFVLWMGLPAGLFISVCIVWQFLNYWRSVATVESALLVMFLAVVGIHAMLELPLHYAYFLLPTGVVMGTLNVRSRAKPLLTTSGRVPMGVGMAGVMLLAVIVVDYFKAEADFQRVRMEITRVIPMTKDEPTQLHVLTQLQERIAFMRYDVKENMTPRDLAWVQSVALAYPGGGGLYKAAKALALNGDVKAAEMLLTKACKVDDCRLIEVVWKQDAEVTPRIAAVPWPN